jgi:creatinine amidohydrolase
MWMPSVRDCCHLLVGKGSFYRVSDTGTWGDPSEATAELGEEHFDTITYAVTELINTFHDVRDDIYKRERPDRAQEQF